MRCLPEIKYFPVFYCIISIAPAKDATMYSINKKDKAVDVLKRLSTEDFLERFWPIWTGIGLARTHIGC
jgi:hypothetical protein